MRQGGSATLEAIKPKPESDSDEELDTEYIELSDDEEDDNDEGYRDDETEAGAQGDGGTPGQAHATRYQCPTAATTKTRSNKSALAGQTCFERRSSS